jgi:hypothetical protein
MPSAPGWVSTQERQYAFGRARWTDPAARRGCPAARAAQVSNVAALGLAAALLAAVVVAATAGSRASRPWHAAHA